MRVLLALHAQRACAREEPPVPENQIFRFIIKKAVAACLRLQRHGEGAVRIDVDPLDRVHLDCDGETHEDSSLTKVGGFSTSRCSCIALRRGPQALQKRPADGAAAPPRAIGRLEAMASRACDFGRYSFRTRQGYQSLRLAARRPAAPDVRQMSWQAAAADEQQIKAAAVAGQLRMPLYIELRRPRDAPPLLRRYCLKSCILLCAAFDFYKGNCCPARSHQIDFAQSGAPAAVPDLV